MKSNDEKAFEQLVKSFLIRTTNLVHSLKSFEIELNSFYKSFNDINLNIGSKDSFKKILLFLNHDFFFKTILSDSIKALSNRIGEGLDNLEKQFKLEDSIVNDLSQEPTTGSESESKSDSENLQMDQVVDN